MKPENVLISDRGRIKVVDFRQGVSSQSSTATQGLLIGTVSYLLQSWWLPGGGRTIGRVQRRRRAL